MIVPVFLLPVIPFILPNRPIALIFSLAQRRSPFIVIFPEFEHFIAVLSYAKPAIPFASPPWSSTLSASSLLVVSYAFTVISALFTHFVNVHLPLANTTTPDALLVVPPTVIFPLTVIFENVHLVGYAASALAFPLFFNDMFTLLNVRFLNVAFFAYTKRLA